ncbi:hypothetical protein EYS14_15520 [Alteromonadaceae bacterium M269]|nr:hypothetical protein EYS14_15520 [Alteromonadaceae bacterium M269]
MSVSQIKDRIGAMRFYILCIAILGATGYGGFLLGNLERSQQAERIKGLEQSLDNLNSDNNAVTKRLNITGVELEVERLAGQNTQKTIKEMLERNNELRRELSFYQKVMAPELEEEGFTIESLNIEGTSSTNFFRFALVVMQRDKRKNYVKGQAKLALVGSQEGKPKRLDLLELAALGNQVEFSFKYFDVIEGEVVLPDGFVPEKVVVNTQLADAKWGKGALQRTFDWQDLVAG